MLKRRTRAHIIADLSVNHVERFVLRCGHVADRVFFDYGNDLTLRTFNTDGDIEPAFALIQLKASDALDYVEAGAEVAIRLDSRDVASWRAERVPVILIAYDAQRDVAYWIHFQAVASRAGGTVRIPTTNIVSEEAVEAMRQLKNQVRGV